jgi:hypothetical protein
MRTMSPCLNALPSRYEKLGRGTVSTSVTEAGKSRGAYDGMLPAPNAYTPAPPLVAGRMTQRRTTIVSSSGMFAPIFAICAGAGRVRGRNRSEYQFRRRYLNRRTGARIRGCAPHRHSSPVTPMRNTPCAVCSASSRWIPQFQRDWSQWKHCR